MKPIIFLLIFLSACSTFKSKRMTRTELFFGLSKPGGGIIATKDWQAFADTVISKTFTKGSTIIDARGQWLGYDGKLVSESSKVLIIISKMDNEQSEKIQQVRAKYKKYFDQESVMRVDGKVKVEY